MLNPEFFYTSIGHIQQLVCPCSFAVRLILALRWLLFYLFQRLLVVKHGLTGSGYLGGTDMPPHLIPPVGHLLLRVRLLVDEWGRPDLLLKILYMVLTARLPRLILLTQQHLRLVLLWIL